MVAATLRAVVEGPPVSLVVGRHASAATAAIDDALAESQSFSGRPSAGARGVSCQALLISQVLLPADVPRMMVLDHHRPFRARLFIRRVANGPVRANDPSRTVASKDI